MAHALWNYDGVCKHIHGHSYKLFVTIVGKPIGDPENIKQGMVMDFGDLKRIVKSVIVDDFDHALVLNSEMPDVLVDELKQNFERIILVDYQPTSELMVADFAERIRERLPDGLELKHLLLRETVTSYAEWYADEN
jgi:6-pyruvoyltetrahydropterin/6-carboxytetrahydropterin synthase